MFDIVVVCNSWWCQQLWACWEEGKVISSRQPRYDQREFILLVT